MALFPEMLPPYILNVPFTYTPLPVPLLCVTLPVLPLLLQSQRVKVTPLFTVMTSKLPLAWMLLPLRHSTTPSAGFHASFSVSVTLSVR